MISATIDEEVMAFVATHTGIPSWKFSPRTTLFGDMGIDGDDGDELLIEFAQRFGVEMGEYRGDRHFGREGFVPWAPIHWLVLAWRAHTEKGSTPEGRARLMPVTIQDLIDSAKSKRWMVSYD